MSKNLLANAGGGGKRRKIVKVFVILGLLVLTGLVGWFAPIAIGNFSNMAAENKAKQEDATREEVQNLRISGKTEEASQKADEALKDPSTSDSQKYRLYIEQGNVPFDKGDYLAAISFYEKAEAIKADYEIVELLGLTWRMADDKEKSIEYYKRAITLIPQDLPVAESRKADLEETIRQLGGTP